MSGFSQNYLQNYQSVGRFSGVVVRYSEHPNDV